MGAHCTGGEEVGRCAAFGCLRKEITFAVARLGVTGRSIVEFTREGFQWTWSIDAGTTADEDQLDEDFAALFENADIRVGLADGRFLSASAGSLSEDKRFATFPVGDLVERHGEGRTETVFVLAWSARCPPRHRRRPGARVSVCQWAESSAKDRTAKRPTSS